MKNFIQSVANALLEVHVFEMAFQRKVVIEKVRSLQGQIADHLCKIALYPEHRARKHWEKEIQSWLSNLNRNFFNGSKKLSQAEYMNFLWNEPFEGTHLVAHVAKTAHGEQGLPKLAKNSFDEAQLTAELKSVYVEICSKISSSDVVNISEILSEHHV
jgi:hypothetical protein